MKTRTAISVTSSAPTLWDLEVDSGRVPNGVAPWNRDVPSPGRLESILVIKMAADGEGTARACTIHLFTQDEWQLIGKALIFFDPRSQYELLASLQTSRLYTWEVFSRKYGRPFTFIPKRSAYAEIARLLGGAGAQQALLDIADIGAWRLARQRSFTYRQRMRHPELVRLLSVDTEAFLALMSLPGILETAPDSDAPAPEKICFNLQSGTGKIEFELLFGEHALKGAQSINALIGENGSGKTRALMALATRAKSEDSAWPHRVLVFGQDRTAIRPHVASTPEFVKIFEMKPEWKGITKRLEDVSLLCLNGETSIPLVERLFGGVISIDSLYVPINSEAIAIGHGALLKRRGRTDYISYIRYLELISEKSRILLDSSAAPLIADSTGEMFAPSSGQSTILSFLLTLFIEARKSTLVLVDEPETNLHPRFVTLLMKRMSDMLLATNSLAVIATHSPFVVRELDKSVVTVLKHSVEQGTALYYPTLQTQGANVSEITSYVFDDDDASKGYESAIDAMESRMQLTAEQLVEAAYSAFGSDAVSYAISRQRK